MAGIYIHIPFCKQACHYCNFHFSTSLKYKDDLIEAICKEIMLQKEYLTTKTLESIYFGGGTPSLLDETDLLKIFETLDQIYSFTPETEITLEANPDDLNKSKLKSLSKSPINRLSIGIQSFFDADLIYFNRAHKASEAKASIINSQDAGFENLTIDLIYGSPSSSIESIQQNIQFLLDQNINHISTYALTVEEKTALSHFIKMGTSPPLNDLKTSNQYDLIMDLLEKEKFQHYEISNFAKEGHLAIHNTNYWKDIEYLGIGPSAHSYDGNSRQWNIANNQKYLRSINDGLIPAESEVLTLEEKYNEYVMTSLRTMWGCNEEKIRLFGPVAYEQFRQNIIQVNKDWIMKSDTNWILSKEGKHYADGIAAGLFL